MWCKFQRWKVTILAYFVVYAAIIFLYFIFLKMKLQISILFTVNSSCHCY
jgi:hypothetical protein